MNKFRILLPGITILVGFIFGAASNSLKVAASPSLRDASPPSKQTSERPAPRRPDAIPSEIALGAAGPALFGQPDLRDLARFGEEISHLESKQIAQLLDALWKVGRANPRNFEDRLSWLFTWWMKRDPEAAQQWIEPKLLAASQDGPNGFNFASSLQGSLILAWAQANPSGAMEFAREHPACGMADRLLAAAMEVWPSDDRQTALRLLLDPAHGANRSESLTALFGKWGAYQSGDAFARAQSLPDGARKIAVSAALSAWSKKDPDAALSGYERSGLQNVRLLSTLVEAVAAKNPADAAAYVTNLDHEQLLRVGPVVAKSWAASDPATALDWALANGLRIGPRTESEKSVEHTSLTRVILEQPEEVEGVLDAALSKQPTATLAWINALQPGPERDRIAELAAEADVLGREDVEKLISSLPPDAAKRAKADR